MANTAISETIMLSVPPGVRTYDGHHAIFDLEPFSSHRYWLIVLNSDDIKETRYLDPWELLRQYKIFKNEFFWFERRFRVLIWSADISAGEISSYHQDFHIYLFTNVLITEYY